jgi:hypothetical protein
MSAASDRRALLARDLRKDVAIPNLGHPVLARVP